MAGTKRYRETEERIELGDLPPKRGTYSPPPPYRVSRAFLSVGRIISGGQRGVDRAALDWAIVRGIPHGGWCPKGRRADNGLIPKSYALAETNSRGYEERTRRNVFMADATLILNVGVLAGGTHLTVEHCEYMGKPHHVVQLDGPIVDEVSRAREWIQEFGPNTLNVAGPRERKRAGIYRAAFEFLDALDLVKAS